MRRLLPILFVAALAYGAVDGTVMNGTAGKPQTGALVTLYKLGQSGMSPVASQKSDNDGKFQFGQSVEGPHLLQTIYGGVVYTQMLSPGSPLTGVTVDVYEPTSKPAAARVTQNMVLLEPTQNQLFVTENVVFQNDGKLTYNDPKNGTVRVFVPPPAQGKIQVSATAPGGLPVQRSAEKTGEANVFKVDFPVKPGETRIDISYSMPLTAPGLFSGRAMQRDGPTRLVVPAGVTLKGDGLEPLGREPQTQASIFGVKGREYKVEISGAGTLRAAQEAAEEESGPSLDQILPKVYNRMYWIVGLGLAILLLGFVVLYRAGSTAPAPEASPAVAKGKRRK